MVQLPTQGTQPSLLSRDAQEYMHAASIVERSMLANAVLHSRNFDAVEVSDWDGVVGSTVYQNGFQVGSFSKRLQIVMHSICRPYLNPILLSIIFYPTPFGQNYLKVKTVQGRTLFISALTIEEMQVEM